MKRFATILGPLYFSFGEGHFRSALLLRAVDPAGNPIPWYTYPAVDFFSRLEMTGRSVAEIGGGHSSLWWMKRADRLLVLEQDEHWCQWLRERTASAGNVEVQHAPTPDQADEFITPDTFDLIVVDGIDRAANAAIAFSRVKRGGLVVLDNSGVNYGPPGEWPIIDRASAEGWLRVDFVGHTAGAMRRSVTSMFFRPEVEMLRDLRMPSFTPVRHASD
jgi:hypothetical protein